MRSWIPAVAVAAFVAAPVQASNVATSYSLSRTPPTDGYPASGGHSFGLSGSWDFSDTLSLDPSLSLYRSSATTDAAGTTTPGSNSVTAGLGASYAWGDHWLFGLAGSFSPAVTSTTGTTLSLQNDKGQTTDVNGTLTDRSGSAGAELSVGYDSAGESALEWGASLAVPVNRYTTLQSFKADTANADNPKWLTFAQQKCEADKKKGLPPTDKCKKLAAWSRAQADAILELPISANLSVTLWDNTGVSLGFTKYFYNKDPDEVGYFTLARQNRNAQQAGAEQPAVKGAQAKDTGGSASFGTGIATGTSDWAASLGASQKLGAWKVSATAAFTKYRNEAGNNLSLSPKVYWKLNKTWRLGVSGSFQRDADSKGDTTVSMSAGANLRYSF